jgi:hypothetical protein
LVISVAMAGCMVIGEHAGEMLRAAHKI